MIGTIVAVLFWVLLVAVIWIESSVGDEPCEPPTTTWYSGDGDLTEVHP